jgi:hypothetical protein
VLFVSWLGEQEVPVPHIRVHIHRHMNVTANKTSKNILMFCVFFWAETPINKYRLFYEQFASKRC